ncbi:hypothetical protein FRX31_002052 [Thalictrum thalictroides]|uniref:Uncharacterized protein n=1 Tax=Thalictrum thalictroides TaxID=46969 RepID=A0A7J6XGX0_THATH|nr:hypothetical protein FRX31_002052 [Thalictrum thalictroides]
MVCFLLQFKGSTPSACLNTIYRRIRKSGGINFDGFWAGDGLERIHKSGSHMFGFSNPKVSKIIKFKGSTPSACLNTIYRRIRKSGGINFDGFWAGDGLERIHKSGSHMFGFSNPKVSKIIKECINNLFLQSAVW